MANPEHLAKLRQGIDSWNDWRKQHPSDAVDLSGAVFESAEWNGFELNRLNLRGAILRDVKLKSSVHSIPDLRGVDLRDSDLNGAELIGADLRNARLQNACLSGAELNEADLRDAILQKADLRGANLSKTNLDGAFLGKANLESANVKYASLVASDLSEANLWKANLSHASMASANFRGADLKEVYAVGADLREANLNSANLRFANFTKAQLMGADLRAVRGDHADLTEANLSGAALFRTSLTSANLSNATLTGADLRAATLFQAKLDGCIAHDVMLWESQRAGWSINGIRCKRAFWDKDAQDPTVYEPGEFENLHSDRACIELFYQGGVSRFELNTLPALLQHLASLHQGANIRLKSIEETGGGARISISVADSDAETFEKIRTDALHVYEAQLALRDNEILRLDTEKKYLETFVSERLIKAMLTVTTPQNVFNAPVYGAAFPSGNAQVEMHQTINDNAAILALLDKILERRGELNFDAAGTDLLQNEVDSAKAELQKPEPSPSMLSRSLKFVQKVTAEAVTKAAGKLGEQVVSADWTSLLHQLNQFTLHLK